MSAQVDIFLKAVGRGTKDKLDIVHLCKMLLSHGGRGYRIKPSFTTPQGRAMPEDPTGLEGFLVTLASYTDKGAVDTTQSPPVIRDGANVMAHPHAVVFVAWRVSIISCSSN